MKSASVAILFCVAMAIFLSAALEDHPRNHDSDIVRHWIVSKYVNAGMNPYQVAKAILIDKFGVGNPERSKVYWIPMDSAVQLPANLGDRFGPPEATYPPSAIGLLGLTVGQFDNRMTVLCVWFAVNIAAVIGVAFGLTRLWPVAPGGLTIADNFRITLLALLVFPPVYQAFSCGQYSLLVVALLLFANNSSSSPWIRGAAVGISLLKPSIAIPFCLLPVVRREWRVIVAAIALQSLASLYVGVRIGEFVTPYRDWMTVSSYFLNGVYNITEWITILKLDTRLPTSLGSFIMLGVCFVTLLAAKGLSAERQFTLVCMTSAFWIYHFAYDFVVLLPVLLYWIGWTDRPPAKRWSVFGLLLFAFLGVAMLQIVTRADYGYAWTRAVRWVARFTVLSMLAYEYFQAWREVLRSRKAGKPDFTPNPALAH